MHGGWIEVQAHDQKNCPNLLGAHERTILGDVRRDCGQHRFQAQFQVYFPPQGWIGTVEMALAGAPSMILRLIAI